jgi:hypothetical protein
MFCSDCLAGQLSTELDVPSTGEDCLDIATLLRRMEPDTRETSRCRQKLATVNAALDVMPIGEWYVEDHEPATPIAPRSMIDEGDALRLYRQSNRRRAGKVISCL